MALSSAETLFISALINTQDIAQGQALGVAPEYLEQHQSEYRWLLSYLATYKTQPSWAVFLSKFPNFNQQDHSDAFFAAEEIRHAQTKRLVVDAIRMAGHLIREGDVEEAYLKLAQIQLPQVSVPLVDVLVDEAFLDGYGEEIVTLATTLPTLSAVTGGMRKGDLCVYAARTGVGKSWVLAHQAVASALAGLKVVYFSLEMSQDQLRSRLHSIAAAKLGLSTTHGELHRRTLDILAYKKLIYQIKETIHGTINIHDFSHGRVTPVSVQTAAQDADLILIDYLGLMSTNTGNRAIEDWRMAASISNQLKEVAVASNVPVMAAAQINRDGDSGGWHPPKVRHLAQSDAIGQDADLVVTMKKYSKQTMVYSVEKNRHGPSDLVLFSHFQPNIAKFGEISRDSADEIKAFEDE